MRADRAFTSSMVGPLLLLTLGPGNVVSFCGARSDPQLLWKLQGKPSPADGLDIDAIEAYALELETGTGRSNDFDDGLDTMGAIESARTFLVPDIIHNQRVDAALALLLGGGTSRSSCGTMILQGRVSVVNEDGVLQQINRKSFRVQMGQVLSVLAPAKRSPIDRIVPEDLNIDILYEDEFMIVLNKAAGMVVHPAPGNHNGTVVNALAHYLQSSSPFGRGDFVASASDDASESITDDCLRPGIVHRLDKGTTGILVVAKTTSALTALSSAFAERKVEKTYLAIAVGNPGSDVVIDKPVGRHPVHRQRMRVVPDPHNRHARGVAPKDRLALSKTGRRAVSFVNTEAFDGKLSLVKVKIATGRTHQIRVHLENRGTPIYGDDVYGLKDWNKKLHKTHQVTRPLLHAYKLELNHPVTREKMGFVAPVPDDMGRVARALGAQIEAWHPSHPTTEPEHTN